MTGRTEFMFHEFDPDVDTESCLEKSNGGVGFNATEQAAIKSLRTFEIYRCVACN